jgi:hypothetical protein
MQSIDEEREDSGSHAPFMGKNEHCNSSNQSGCHEVTKKIQLL